MDKHAAKDTYTELERAGIIQFFEITFELSWKVLKDYLEAQGYMVRSPRESIKQAYQMEIVTDGHTWMEALSRRNQTTHTYDEQVAEEFVEEISKTFLPAIAELYEQLRKVVD